VSIKAKKMVLAAGVSALALMMMSAAVVAQEIDLTEPTGCEPIVEPIVAPIIEPEEFTLEYVGGDEDAGAGPDVIIDDGAEIGDPDLPLLDIVPVVDAGVEEPVIEVDPVVVIEDDADPVVIEDAVEPTEIHTLDDGTVVSVDVVEKTADEVMQTLGAPAILTAGQSVQERAARATDIPNLCDTAAGQKNQFFCGSYHKK
jgi:hypothetical protein